MARRPVPPGLLARLRADAGVAVVIVLVIAVTAGTAAAVGRSLQVLTADSIRDEVANANPSAVGVTASAMLDRDLARTGVFAGLQARGTAEAEQLPPPLSTLVGPPATVVDSVRFTLGPLPDEPALPLTTNLTFRSQDPAEEHLRVVEGRVPAVSDLEVELQSAVEGEPGPMAPVMEIALSATTMERTGLALGSRVVAVPDPADPLARRAGLISLAPVVVEVVGRIELSAAEDPVWWGDPRLHRPAQIDTGTTTTYFAFGWVPPDVDGVLPGDGNLPGQVDWRFPVDAEDVAAEDPDAVLAAARALTATNAGLVASFELVVASSRLDRILGDEVVRRGVAFNVLRLGMVAIAGVGIAVLALLAALLRERRQERVALTRGRGASGAQLLTAAAVEALLLAVVGGAIGLVAAVVVVPGVVERADVLVVVGVALGSAVALAVGGTRGQRRPLRELLASDDRAPSTSLRGLVVEGAVVVVAVVGVSALRRRGVDPSEPDTFVVLVPALVGVAAGLVLRRLHRLPIRAMAAAARRRRGLASAVGLLRGARQDLAGPMVVVVVLAVAVALFAGAVSSTIARGQDVAAWEDVGAHWRIDAQFGGATDGVAIPGTTNVTGSLLQAPMNSGNSAFGRGDVLATDLAAMEGLLRDTAAPLQLPSRALREPTVTDGGATPLLPAIASTLWFNNQRLRINDQVDVTFAATRITYQIVGFRRRVLGLDEDQDGVFLLVPRDATAAVIGRDLVPNVQFVGEASGDAVRAAAPPDAIITSQDETRTALAARALPRGVAVGYLAIAVTALAFATLALLIWQSLTSQRRVRDLAVLSALGTPRRTRFGVALAEGLPAVLIGIIAGSVVGRIVGDLLDGVIDLGPFTGTPTVDDIVATAEVSVWGTAAIAGVAMVLVAGLTWRGDRADAARLLRQD